MSTQNAEVTNTTTVSVLEPPTEFLTLNDDCLRTVVDHLDLQGLIQVCRVNSRIRNLAYVDRRLVKHHQLIKTWPVVSIGYNNTLQWVNRPKWLGTVAQLKRQIQKDPDIQSYIKHLHFGEINLLPMAMLLTEYLPELRHITVPSIGHALEFFQVFQLEDDIGREVNGNEFKTFIQHRNLALTILQDTSEDAYKKLTHQQQDLDTVYINIHHWNDNAHTRGMWNELRLVVREADIHPDQIRAAAV